MKLSLEKDLTPLKEKAVASINDQVEDFRVSYLTPGSAQALVYQEKNTELKRYYDQVNFGIEPKEKNFPYLMIDARLYGMSLDNAAAFVGYFRDQWEMLGPVTEEIRRSALVKVEAARTVLEIEKATRLDFGLVRL